MKEKPKSLEEVDPKQIEKVYKTVKNKYVSIDFIVHFFAYAEREDLGGNFSDLSHKSLNFSYLKETELVYTIRYGLLLEKLELIVNGSYNQNKSVNTLNNSSSEELKSSFLNKQTLGFKYLVFDPYKNKKWHGTSVYSWKKNNNLRHRR